MKKIQEVIIKPNINKEETTQAFHQYLQKPNIASALKIIYLCLAESMVGSNVNQITLSFEKIDCLGMFKDGKIKVSLKHLKKVKKIEYLPILLNTIFHEFSHAKTDFYNNIVLTTQTNKYEYMFSYPNGIIYNLLLKITDYDYDLAGGITMYYYIHNKNEILARQEGYDYTKKFLNEYCPKQSFKLETPKEATNRLLKNLYLMHKDLYYCNNLPELVLKDYQNKILNKLINKPNKQSLSEVLATMYLYNSEKTRQGLVQFAINCDNMEYAKEILTNNFIKVTEQELEKLKQIYGENEIKKYIFGEFKILKNK